MVEVVEAASEVSETGGGYLCQIPHRYASFFALPDAYFSG